MSLIELRNLEQNTPEWFAARAGLVTASVVGKLVSQRGPSADQFGCPECDALALAPCVSKVKRGGEPGAAIKTFHAGRTERADVAKQNGAPPLLEVSNGDEAKGLTAKLAAERITGYVEPTWASEAMLQGHIDEVYARDLYSEHYAPARELGFMVRDDWGFRIGYSPDGLVGDDGLIEVKSRHQKKQLQTILADEVPAENMAQLQCGLLVSGRDWIDYLSYCGGMPMYRKRVEPDARWFDAIVAAVQQFEDNAARIVAEYHATVKRLNLPLTERPVDLEMVA